TSVTHESAVLNGTITAGSEEITAQGFRYKTATASEWIEVSATGTTISATVNNLTAETAYVFKAFATTASGTVEGTEMTFTTIAAPIVVVEGEVTTTPATNIANTSATLNGALVSAGNSENYTIGFALATVADFTLEDAGVQNITATLNGSTFSQAVNDLVEGQTYFYRAYITNEAGTAYGTVETFTLLGLTDAIAGMLQATIYPNPATDNATLEINGLNQDAKIVISDLQGRILSQDNINAGTTRYTINVSDMTSGVYYIRIITDNVVSTQKLIVE
ncbi:MAG: T9SS type A sorting domain-containing protein, partial [Bacteroidales bacterium]|nr:T9SS type A sorting domain-containing protein [Bacteroidales bacterium]